MSRKLLFLLFAVSFAFLSAPARAEMDDYPMILLQSLDKVTARTMTFEAKVGSTIKYGPFYIKIRACRKAPPIDPPESAAFLQIWEITSDDEAAWIFSGWMFASSPALSSMDHSIYDVWVLDCKGDVVEEAFEEVAKEKLEPVVSDQESDRESTIESATMPETNDEYNERELQDSLNYQGYLNSQDSSEGTPVTSGQPAVQTFEQMNTNHGADIEVENLMEE